MIFKRFRKSDKQKPQPKQRRQSLGPSIITAEVAIDGTLLSNGELQVDGEVNGDVRARAVVVDVNGVVHGEVAGEDVIVRGRIIGPIRGLHVHILNGAHVEGDVLNETISIENGAFVDGKINRVDDPLGTANDTLAEHDYYNTSHHDGYDRNPTSTYSPPPSSDEQDKAE